MVTKAAFDAATARASARRATGPLIMEATYDRARNRIVIDLNSGIQLRFPPQVAEGLQAATPAQLAKMEVTHGGLGVHWPAIDADLYLPALLEGALGSRSWMASTAARLGAKGGSTRSAAKAAAARENGRKGGRPAARSKTVAIKSEAAAARKRVPAKRASAGRKPANRKAG